MIDTKYNQKMFVNLSKVTVLRAPSIFTWLWDIAGPLLLEELELHTFWTGFWLCNSCLEGGKVQI